MGDTRDSLEARESHTLAFVLAIEGYTNLITTWADTAAVNTAWASTGYSASIRGLMRPGEMSNHIVPFSGRMETSTATFVILPDHDDTFAQDVFAYDKSTGAQMELNTTAGVTGNIVVKSATDFASSGSLYIGTERASYSAKSSTTFTITTRGTPVPFGRNGSTTMAHPHTILSQYGGKTAYPIVSDFPRTWIGRWVGCWVHRVVDGVLDVKSEAECIFAGKIADIDDSETGATILSCVDVRDVVANHVVMADQWSAQTTPGIVLETRDKILIRSRITTTTPSYTDQTASSSAGGTYLPSGQTTVEELIEGINDWFDNIAFTGGTSGYQEWAIRKDANQNRCIFRVLCSGTNVNRHEITIKMTPRIAALLGFTIVGNLTDFSTYVGFTMSGIASSNLVTLELAGDLHPAIADRARPKGITNVSGTFIDQATSLPPAWRVRMDTEAAGEWGVFEYNGQFFVGKKVSDTEINARYDDFNHYFNPVRRDAAEPGTYSGIKDDDFLRDIDNLPRIRQIIILQDDIDTLLIKMLASESGKAYNHATYDVLDYGLGVGIPWDLLGTNLVNSAGNLAEGQVNKEVTLIIEKPTRFEDLWQSELVMRNSHLIWDEQGIRFASPTKTTSASALWTLTASNKAGEPGQGDHLSVAHISRNDMITHLKVHYNRDPTDVYHSSFELINAQAATDHGANNPLTIKARNQAFFEGANSDEMKDLLERLSGDIIAFYSKPRLIVTRSIGYDRFFAAPTDAVALTDNFVRDPQTGTRGVTGHPGWVTAVTRDWRTMRGTITVVLHEDANRLVLMSPALRIDSGASGNGYNPTGSGGNPTIYVDTNEYTVSGDADANYFTDGDEITICERSPSTTGSPTKWNRTIDTIVDSNTITLTSGLSSPAWDNTLEYYVISQPFASASSTQATRTFIADDSDGFIQNSGRSKSWGNHGISTRATLTAALTERHAYPVTDGTVTAEGAAYNPETVIALQESVNNLLNRRTAPHMPVFGYQIDQTGNASYCLPTTMYPFQIYTGNQSANSFLSRNIKVRPLMRTNTTNDTAYVRVTSSAYLPRGSGAALPDVRIFAVFREPYAQIEFTSNSTAYSSTPAAQDLPIIRSPFGPYTWITVEYKTTSSQVFFHGFLDFWFQGWGE